MNKPLLVVENLIKHYPRPNQVVEVLKGLHFTLEREEIVAIVGASGVGKSTLLHVLGTIEHATSGKIFYDGQDITIWNPASLAIFRNQALGFIFQFHFLLPEFNALENVFIPALIGGISHDKASARAKDLLDQMGLSQRFYHFPQELSGGEQQRVAVARALMMRPKLVLADEPTGNLDPDTGASVYEIMLEAHRQAGTAMMIVTHNEDLARRTGRVLTLSHGMIA